MMSRSGSYRDNPHLVRFRVRFLLAGAVTALILLAAIAQLAAAHPVSARADSAACTTGCARPDLSLGNPAPFWASYSDFRSRELSVILPVTNDGGSEAYNLTLTGVLTNNGVTAVTPFPQLVSASLTCGSTGKTTIGFSIPGGVSWFRLGGYLTAEDFCGNGYDYPYSPAGSPETPGGVAVFPPDNIWNTPVDTLPVDADSAAYIATIGAGTGFHPDFGSGTWEGGPIGIPFIEVDGGQPPAPVTFDYADESDPGPYPVPSDVPIEGGPDATGDRHALVIDRDHKLLYELYDAWPQPDGSWHAGSGAVFDLRSNDLRPDSWTSADAAGLPIFPGLIRYDEVASGEIRHAIRFTAPQTRRAYVWPARHYASYLTGSQYPPMGQRFRLRADFDISGFSPEVRVILTAMKRYGIILADNGAPWFISGAPDERWNNDDLHMLDQVHGSDLEAVDESSLMVDADSAQAHIP